MKFLVEIIIPTETCNEGLKDGTVMKQLNEYLAEVKPLAVYFGIKDGQRTMYMVINMEKSEKIPEIAEPLWLDWHASISFMPIMDEKDFEKAMPEIKKIIEKRI